MTIRPRFRRSRRALLITGAAGALAAGALVTGIASGPAKAAPQGVCDIYSAGGTPCVAAHSTTRALYGTYDGPLYQVRRSSDNTTMNIYPLAAGGVANAATQDSFCAGTCCVITEIFDQSGNGNNLTEAPGGGAAGGPDGLANATAAPVTVSGQPAYGVYIAPGDGYRDNSTRNIATGNNPEGIYDVVDGTHFNGGCCFDYGNAETNNDDDGAGTMEAVYFGNIRVWGYGSGNGPWIMGDLENGLYSGSAAGLQRRRPDHQLPVHHRDGRGQLQQPVGHLGGNAQSGGLSTDFSGTRPSGYYPMKKQGAIILGTGGDNSDGAVGTWYEGVMTSGEPSASTEAAVQANIVAAGYSTSSSTGGGGATGPITAGADSQQVRRRQRAVLRQRHQDPDVGLQRRRQPALDPLVQRHPAGLRQVHGHHRRQLQQRHQHRAVAVQRRRQPAMAGQQRARWSTPPPASASTTRTSTPPTAPNSTCGPATGAPTSTGPSPDPSPWSTRTPAGPAARWPSGAGRKQSRQKGRQWQPPQQDRRSPQSWPPRSSRWPSRCRRRHRRPRQAPQCRNG